MDEYEVCGISSQHDFPVSTPTLVPLMDTPGPAGPPADPIPDESDDDIAGGLVAPDFASLFQKPDVPFATTEPVGESEPDAVGFIGGRTLEEGVEDIMGAELASHEQMVADEAAHARQDEMVDMSVMNEGDDDTHDTEAELSVYEAEGSNLVLPGISFGMWVAQPKVAIGHCLPRLPVVHPPSLPAVSHASTRPHRPV